MTLKFTAFPNWPMEPSLIDANWLAGTFVSRGVLTIAGIHSLLVFFSFDRKLVHRCLLAVQADEISARIGAA